MVRPRPFAIVVPVQLVTILVVLCAYFSASLRLCGEDLELDSLELAGLFGQSDFGGQAFHAAGAIEAVAGLRVL